MMVVPKIIMLAWQVYLLTEASPEVEKAGGSRLELNMMRRQNMFVVMSALETQRQDGGHADVFSLQSNDVIEDEDDDESGNEDTGRIKIVLEIIANLV